MNSTARAWLNIRRAERHRLHDDTAAQVARLQALARGTSLFDVGNRRPSFSAQCRLATRNSTTGVLGKNEAAAQVTRAVSELSDEELRKREQVSREETGARITILSSMLHYALQLQGAGEADGSACKAAGRGSSASGMAPRLYTPTPFSKRGFRR
ncbi:hypothetical protein LSCM1_04275 [Leishmania martiniquensis]|uniref:Uncharacterized protein n=1 Tax=Leishmania martiniquensis TaxID=1580590 RepID=A0A836HGT0_9TRYP|nr:hypothetical protein LSCM1_04275 [Leishmania martiniquensis]